MERLRTCRPWLVIGAFCALTMSTASAGTIATFSDPAADGVTPLFELSGDKLNGGWSGTGMLLQTPGLPIPDVANATFTMSELTVTYIVPNVFGSTDAGTVEFYDSNNLLVMLIEFDAAYLTTGVSLGGSDVNLQNVRFTVPGVPIVFDDEYFAFSFANGMRTANGWTWTSAFTSSAIPEPSAGLLMLFSALFGLRRR